MKDIELTNGFKIFQSRFYSSIARIGGRYNIIPMAMEVPKGKCLIVAHSCRKTSFRFTKIEDGKVICRSCKATSTLSPRRLKFMMKMIRINL